MIPPYLATLATFLVIDAFWLRAVMRPLVDADLGHLVRPDVDRGVAAGFHALYCAGLMRFAVLPGAGAGSAAMAALDGAIIGALAYGAHAAASKATLRGWTWRVVAVDVAWGASLSALASTIGALVAMGT